MSHFKRGEVFIYSCIYELLFISAYSVLETLVSSGETHEGGTPDLGLGGSQAKEK